MDFDGKNITRIEIYGSVDGDRQGQMFESVDIGDAQGGWTLAATWCRSRAPAPSSTALHRRSEP